MKSHAHIRERERSVLKMIIVRFGINEERSSQIKREPEIARERETDCQTSQINSYTHRRERDSEREIERERESEREGK